MADTVSFKRLILRAVLRQVSPMVNPPDLGSLTSWNSAFHDIFRAILGWDGDLGYLTPENDSDEILTQVLTYFPARN